MKKKRANCSSIDSMVVLKHSMIRFAAGDILLPLKSSYPKDEGQKNTQSRT